MSLRRTKGRFPTSLPVVVMFFALCASADDSETAPQEVVESAATTMAEKLNGRKDYYEANLEELYLMIDEVLLPHFDTRYSGRLVLGKHWKGTAEEQRADFIDVFYQSLLQSYAQGLLEFDQDKIEFLPFQGDLSEKRVVVKTQMHLDDGSEVPVNYSMRRSGPAWKVYDVRIEGVSYIQNYRNQFNAEISANGVDSVIERLRAEASVEAKAIEP